MEKSNDIPKDIVDKYNRLVGNNDFELWKHHPKDNGKISIFAKCKHCPNKLVAADNNSFGNYTKHMKNTHKELYDEYIKAKQKPKTTKEEGQQTLDHLVTSTTSGKKALLDKLIMKYIVNGIRPLSTVEDSDFRQLLRGALGDDKIKFMSRKTLKTKITDEYTRVKTDIISKLSKAQILCLTADCWSSRAKSFLGITAHFISSDLQRQNIILACRRFRGSHTYDKIALGINQIMADFKIPREKVVAIVTDNGKNFVKAFDEYSLDFEENKFSTVDTDLLSDSDSDESEDEEIDTVPEQLPISELLETNMENPYNLPPHLRCVAHTLNLVITRDVKKVVSTGLLHKAMGKCTKVFNLASSPKSAEAIQKVCGKLLKTPGSTRWNSLYDSLKHLFQFEEVLDEIFHALKVTVLSKKEKEFLREYIQLSEPVAIALDTLQGDKDVYLGNLLPAILGLQANIIELKENLKHTVNFANAILEGLKKRFSLLLEMDSQDPSDFVFASMSNPFFKLRWIPADQRDAFKLAFINRCKELNGITCYTQTDSSQANKNGLSQQARSMYKFYDNGATISSGGCKTQLECLQYFDDQDDTLSVLKRYPTVENMFLRYNTCLPSSASAERLFSAAGLILSPKRSKLGDEIFNTLVFLKCNKTFTEDVPKKLLEK